MPIFVAIAWSKAEISRGAYEAPPRPCDLPKYPGRDRVKPFRVSVTPVTHAFCQTSHKPGYRSKPRK